MCTSSSLTVNHTVAADGRSSHGGDTTTAKVPRDEESLTVEEEEEEEYLSLLQITSSKHGRTFNNDLLPRHKKSTSKRSSTAVWIVCLFMSLLGIIFIFLFLDVFKTFIIHHSTANDGIPPTTTTTTIMEWYSTEDCDLTSSKLTNDDKPLFLAETAIYDDRKGVPTFVPINKLRSTTVSKRKKEWDDYVALTSKCDFEPSQEEKKKKKQQQQQQQQLVAKLEGLISFEEAEEAEFVEEKHDDEKNLLCNIPDDSESDVHWTIERFGPFRTQGGYTSRFKLDHHTLFAPEWTHGKELYVLGGAVHPVDAKTLETITYPPIHIHHAHIYPYDMATYEKVMVVPNNVHSWEDSHPVMIQAHGDTACVEEEGGEACLLKTLADGHGYRVSNFTGSFAVDFDSNDVRIKDNSTEPIEYYMQLAVKWTLKKQTPTTFLNFQNPIMRLADDSNKCDGGLGSTYKYEREKTTYLYFNYTNEFLGNGRILVDSLMLHSHQTLSDSVWMFKGDDVYAALEDYRAKAGKGDLPIKTDGSVADLTEEKENIIRHLKETVDFTSNKNQLLCEVPSPNLACKKSPSSVDRDDIAELLYDRRVQMYCQNKDDIKLNENETLTVIAFNLAEPSETSVGPTWGSGDKEENWRMLEEDELPGVDDYESSGEPCPKFVEQHTIIRADFVRDDASTLEASSLNPTTDLQENKFAPPSYYGWQSWPNGKVEMYLDNELQPTEKKKEVDTHAVLTIPRDDSLVESSYRLDPSSYSIVLSSSEMKDVRFGGSKLP